MCSYADKFIYDQYLLDNFRNMSDKEVFYDEHGKERKIHWRYLSCQWRYRLPEDFILRFYKHLDFYELSNRKNFSKEILEDYLLSNYWNRNRLLEVGTKYIPNFIIKEYLSDLRNVKFWGYAHPIFNNLEFDRLEVMIKEHPEFINWEVVSTRGDLTIDFIKSHLDKLDLDILINYSDCFKKIKKIDKEFANMVKVLRELVYCERF